MAQEENQQEQSRQDQPSSVDRANEVYRNTLKLRRTYKKVKGLRTTVNAFRAARAGVAAVQTGGAALEGAAATSPIWAPASVIGLIILIIVVTLIILFGGGQNVNAGTPDACASIGGYCNTGSCTSPDLMDTSGASCSASLTGQPQICCIPPSTSTGCSAPPTCASGDYLSCLKNQFGITMKGTYSSNDLNIVFNGFAVGFKYPIFLTWFKSVRPTVTISPYSTCPSNLWCDGAWATVTAGAQMTLYQKFLSASSRYQRVVLVHEAAHMAMQASSTANNTQYTLYANAYTNRLNRSCYSSLGILKTYPANLIPLSQLTYDRKVHESWADSVADSVLCPANTTCPSNGGGGTSIYDFPGTCSYIYNYVKTSLGC